MINPIADALNETIPSLQEDKDRPVTGFLKFARESVEFERFQRTQLMAMLENHEFPVSGKLYSALTHAMQYGFEAGKSYVISGRVEGMLKLEDDFNKQREREHEREYRAAPPPLTPLTAFNSWENCFPPQVWKTEELESGARLMRNIGAPLEKIIEVLLKINRERSVAPELELSIEEISYIAQKIYAERNIPGPGAIRP